MARPGLAAAILTTAIYILEDFGNPALIGGLYTVLPTQAYGLISGFGDVTGAAVGQHDFAFACARAVCRQSCGSKDSVRT